MATQCHQNWPLKSPNPTPKQNKIPGSELVFHSSWHLTSKRLLIFKLSLEMPFNPAFHYIPKLALLSIHNVTICACLVYLTSSISPEVPLWMHLNIWYFVSALASDYMPSPSSPGYAGKETKLPAGARKSLAFALCFYPHLALGCSCFTSLLGWFLKPRDYGSYFICIGIAHRTQNCGKQHNILQTLKYLFVESMNNAAHTLKVKESTSRFSQMH